MGFLKIIESPQKNSLESAPPAGSPSPRALPRLQHWHPINIPPDGGAPLHTAVRLTAFSGKSPREVSQPSGLSLPEALAKDWDCSGFVEAPQMYYQEGFRKYTGS